MRDLSRLELFYDSERWDRAQSVYGMLFWLKSQHPATYKSFSPVIHRYLIASCEQIWYLLPHKHSRYGVDLAKAWLAGELSKTEMFHQNYYVEGAAFFFDYAENDEDITELKRYIDAVPELLDLPFEDARRKLRDAAYLADKAMMFPFLRGGIWRWWSTKDYLLDPKLLREFLPSERLFKAIENANSVDSSGYA